MKKVLYPVGLLVFALLFMGCSSDSSNNPSTDTIDSSTDTVNNKDSGSDVSTDQSGDVGQTDIQQRDQSEAEDSAGHQDSYKYHLAWQADGHLTSARPAVTSDGNYVGLYDTDGGKLFLYKKDGTKVFEVKAGESGSGLAMTDNALFVVEDWIKDDDIYTGVRVFDFKGNVIKEEKFWYGLVPDDVWVSNNRKYVCFAVSGKVGCYDTKTMATIYKTDLKDTDPGTIQVSDKGYVVVFSSKTYFLDPQGKILWKKHNSTNGSVVVDDRALLSDNGNTYLIDAKGNIVAQYRGKEFVSYRGMDPIINSKYIMANIDEKTYFFDHDLNKKGKAVDCTPMAANDHVVVTFCGDNNNLTHVYDVDSRKELAHFNLPGLPLFATISDNSNTIVFLSNSGDKIWVYTRD